MHKVSRWFQQKHGTYLEKIQRPCMDPISSEFASQVKTFKRQLARVKLEILVIKTQRTFQQNSLFSCRFHCPDSVKGDACHANHRTESIVNPCLERQKQMNWWNSPSCLLAKASSSVLGLRSRGWGVYRSLWVSLPPILRNNSKYFTILQC